MTKRTKIVCTIGPSSWDVPTLKKMISAGMNVARINTAFTKPEELKDYSRKIREISSDVAMLLDIKGNDIRLNNFEKPIELKKGMKLEIGSTEKDPIYTTHLDLYKDIKPGDSIFFDDGCVKADVIEVKGKKIIIKIQEGKILNPGKSLNTPGVYLNIPVITTKDKANIKVAIEDKWDFIAGSYIRNKEDAKALKNSVKGTDIKVIAKIEEGMGVSNIDEILEIVDGIMVARGDMGVELPYEQIPAIQKMLIEKCNEAAKPVITATQVLESMKENPTPTRAEITDTANAVWDGTDAIMTSGETSTGNNPVETVKAITRISQETEKYLMPMLIEHPNPKGNKDRLAMSKAAFEVATTAITDKILVISENDKMARQIARYDLRVPIIAFVSNDTFKRQLALTKNVKAHVFPEKYTDRDDAIKGIIKYALKNEVIKKTDKILILGKAHSNQTYFPNIFEYIDLKDYK